MDIFIDPSFSKYYKQSPLTLVDIGARPNYSLKDNWQKAQKYLRTIGFEPDERSFARLENSPAVLYLNTALYKEKSTLNFYLTRAEFNSSILKPNRALLKDFGKEEAFDIVKTVQIKADTLDNQLDEHHVQDADFIRIDTQGSELFILEGAADILGKKIFGVEVEVEFLPVYEGQPLFADVDRLLTQLGFQLFDLCPHYWKRRGGEEYGNPKGQLIYADVLYLKNIENLEDMLKQEKNEPSVKSKLLKAMSICFLYGYLDYAMAILLANSSLFTGDEVQAISELIKGERPLPKRIPSFRGRARIADTFYELWRIFSPASKKTVAHGKMLGNSEIDSNMLV